MKQGVTSVLPLLTALVLAAPAARGQAKPPSVAELAAARELFGAAAELEAASQWALAITKLKSALAIKETPGLRYHLAHCEEQLGSLVAAAADYERAAELIRAGAPAPDVETLLPPALRRIDARVAKLELLFPAGTAAVAELDGRLLPQSALAAPVRLEPGVHRLLVRAKGEPDYRAELALASAETRTLRLFFPKAQASAAQPPHALAATPDVTPRPAAAPGPTGDARRGFELRTAVLIGEAAVALTGVGLGIGYALARHGASGRIASAQRELDLAAPGDYGACDSGMGAPACAELQSALDDHSRAVTIETASFIGAGAAAGLFALTWVLWPASPKNVAITLQPRASGAGLLVGGTF